VLRRGRSGPFGATSEKLVRGCAAQAADFENWPFDAIERAAGPDETQRNALAALRDAAKQAAQRLTNDCPQDVPAAPAARLEAVEQGIDAALKAFDPVEPKLQAFYAALNDEQKARLYRDMAAPAATNAGDTGRHEERRERYSSRRDRWRAYAAAREAAAREGAPGWSGACEELAAVLRNWPVREIERDVRLSSPQRVAFYELVTASLKAAGTLGSACTPPRPRSPQSCPAYQMLTPTGRVQAMEKRLDATLGAVKTVQPTLAKFYNSLSDEQKARFNSLRSASRPAG
jgi:hypothetical protein